LCGLGYPFTSAPVLPGIAPLPATYAGRRAGGPTWEASKDSRATARLCTAGSSDPRRCMQKRTYLRASPRPSGLPPGSPKCSSAGSRRLRAGRWPWQCPALVTGDWWAAQACCHSFSNHRAAMRQRVQVQTLFDQGASSGLCSMDCLPRMGLTEGPAAAGRPSKPALSALGPGPPGRVQTCSTAPG
jgi:hypothetical protein